MSCDRLHFLILTIPRDGVDVLCVLFGIDWTEDSYRGFLGDLQEYFLSLVTPYHLFLE